MFRSSWETPAKQFAPGIGQAVADRTVARIKPDGTREDWTDVAYRVAVGNTMLNAEDSGWEFEPLHRHLRQASVLMSGRHLQHGDSTQPTRNQEVFTNCATSASTFILFYLLLNGSGVGRSYDDDMMVVDWSKNMPYVIPVINRNHKDVVSGEIGREFVYPDWPKEEMNGEYPPHMRSEIFEVPDSREGWAKAIEKIEYMTWTGDYAEKILILDFSAVRPRGAPIGGMQNRPASGPGPLMNAIRSIASLKNSGMAPWLATMQADHFAAECVLVGGARRAARMATKSWRDKSVFEFIRVKESGGLWSSNNSVTVDEEFWEMVKADMNDVELWEDEAKFDLAIHARYVFECICKSSYGGSGEPGIINVERLVQRDEGVEELFDGNYAKSDRFILDEETLKMTGQIAQIFANKTYTQITNPCGEISLSMLGGYCVIADVVPYHTNTDNDAEDAFRTAVRALLRTNTMNCLYAKEVARTNRIGVGMTGLHEYAWKRFGYGWKDIVDEEKSIDFWRMLSRFSNACVDEAIEYSGKLGQRVPHTVITMKPAGTTSKLFGLTEGAHLPSMAHYLRWVQFRNDDPLIADYEAKGYPIRRNLKTYSGTTIVGFPTIPEICHLGMGDKLVTASEATPEEQYEYLRLLEKWWIDGYQGDDGTELGAALAGGHGFGNQNSYTLKYKPTVTNYDEFRRTLLEGQSTVKCCSVMPEGDTSSYEYLPEQPLSVEEFDIIVALINDDEMKQDIGLEHVDCQTGACPINFDTSERLAA